MRVHLPSSNGFQTRRALHALAAITFQSVDVPGGFRFKPPYPKSVEMHPKLSGHAESIKPGQLLGAPLGYPRSPDDLLIDSQGQPVRIDKAFFGMRRCQRTD